MKNLIAFLLVIVISAISFAAPLPRSTPEEQGVSSAAVISCIEALDKIDSMNSLMLVRHGQVVAEGWWAPYSAQSPHALFSLSKSFTSTAVGMAIAEGKLSVSDPILKFFPDDAPANPSANLKSMRISDLLRMSTGQQNEPGRNEAESWAKTFLAQPVPFKPGTHFLYNTSATYMASAIVQKATGMTVLDYLRPRLFEPLEIENPTWEASPQGISAGGFGLSIRTEGIAKFGQLYLQKGKWQGKQLVPESWVAAATSRQTSNGSNPASDWDQGYGYQFWRCRHNAYRGDGAFGQYCVVMPKEDAVLAITSGVPNMQQVLDIVWDKLLPGIQSPNPLAADESTRQRLESTLKGLSVRPAQGSATAASGIAGKRFVFTANEPKVEAIALETDKDGSTTITARIDGKDQRLVCAKDGWHKGRFSWGKLAEQPAAASAAWCEDDCFTAKVCFYETPYILTLKLKFSAEQVKMDSEMNVGFGATKDQQLVGKAK